MCIVLLQTLSAFIFSFTLALPLIVVLLVLHRIHVVWTCFAFVTVAVLVFAHVFHLVHHLGLLGSSLNHGHFLLPKC